MKFGFLLPNYGPTASPELVLWGAQFAEEVGFDSVWTTDHVMVPHDQAVPYGHLIESLVALTMAATVTRRVSLGTSIIVLPQREPILLAKQLAAIDVLSGGRLIFGAGAGWLEEEFNWLNAPFVKRGQAFEEYVDLMRTLWGGGEAFQGEFVHFEDALFAPLPVQRERLPVYIAGNSQTAIRRAARMGDGWHPVALSPKDLAKSVATLRAEAEGRSVAVSLRATLEFPGMGGLHEQLSAGSIASWHILRGESEAIVQELQAYQAAGLEHIALWFFHKDQQELEASLTKFAREVMPAFR